jgi:hypothetical protein
VPQRLSYPQNTAHKMKHFFIFYNCPAGGGVLVCFVSDYCLKLLSWLKMPPVLGFYSKAKLPYCVPLYFTLTVLCFISRPKFKGFYLVLVLLQ